MLRPVIGVSVAVLLLAWSTTARAQAPPTDANLITAIDVSGSIDAAAEALQFAGIADALVHPAFLQTVAAGYHGRVGFAAFTWSSHGHFVTLVPWTVIESPASAAAVAAQLRRVVSPPRQFPPSAAGAAPRPWQRDLMTDVSATLEHAFRLLLRAPFATGREVINVLANGTDNVAEGPHQARAWALERGVVVNGLVLGGDEAVEDYFRERVRGGPGSFVIATREPSDVTWAMLQKFLLDLAGSVPDPFGNGPAGRRARSVLHSTPAHISRRGAHAGDRPRSRDHSLRR